ncbi:unnamed protein product [Angiostrongylus costaricensis]|uniref:Uncharacterized protein n=1 Tax=Angiostrongylus costaricensis TaxID=334426 RepID=A0A0R3PPY4_ANGCS|nr:unnamed protein product [Angiostrongylus costaricensis]
MRSGREGAKERENEEKTERIRGCQPLVPFIRRPAALVFALSVIPPTLALSVSITLYNERHRGKFSSLSSDSEGVEIAVAYLVQS